MDSDGEPSAVILKAKKMLVVRFPVLVAGFCGEEAEGLKAAIKILLTKEVETNVFR